MEDVADWPAPAAVETAAGESKSREKQLSRTSSSDSDEMYSGGSPKEILKQGGKAIAPTGEPNVIFIPHVIDKTLILDRNNNNNHLMPPSTVTLLDIAGDIDIGYQKPAQDEQELYLQTLYNIPNSHNFYCPNCKSCITKVIILRDTPSSPSSSTGKAPPPPQSYPLPPSDLPPPPSDLLPVKQPGSHVPDLGEIVETDDGNTIAGREDGGRIVCGNCFSFLDPIGAWISSQLGFGKKKSAIPTEIEETDAATSRPGTIIPTRDGGSSSISPGPEVEVVVDTAPLGDEPAGQNESGGRSLEIIKSIVYGGLTEAITSLGIVTSAASASTPTENIVALALANLITGLIVITNNLSGLKSNQLKKEPNETDEPQVDPYEEALGDRAHYLLHFTTAILSFLLFGLLPPLVYGFSFRDTDNGDLKLAAVAVTSLLCIALLAIAKAYVQKPHTWQSFAKTLVYYITLGFGASGLSYLAGKEFDMLLEQLGWFKKNPMPPTLLLPNMDFAKPTWGSI